MTYVYLLHFDQPISNHHTCQHYIGFADDLAVRIQRHQVGHGARLTQVAKQRGIGFKVARVWQGDRLFERWLKRQKNSPAFCPVCQGHSQRARLYELSPEQIANALIPF